MLTGFILSIAVSATAVPPGAPVANHASPGKYAQPTIVRFERREVDEARRAAWNAYVAEFDSLWLEYRKTSTPEAFRDYQSKAMAAKRRYVYQDPYLAAVPVSDDYLDGNGNGNGCGK